MGNKKHFRDFAQLNWHLRIAKNQIAIRIWLAVPALNQWDVTNVLPDFMCVSRQTLTTLADADYGQHWTEERNSRLDTKYAYIY